MQLELYRSGEASSAAYALMLSNSPQHSFRVFGNSRVDYGYVRTVDPDEIPAWMKRHIQAAVAKFERCPENERFLDTLFGATCLPGRAIDAVLGMVSGERYRQRRAAPEVE